MSQTVQPSPGSTCTSVPVTVTGSPICELLNTQLALSSDRFTQPWLTLSEPWSPTDHGAACRYCPSSVNFSAKSTVTRYSPGTSNSDVRSWVMSTKLPDEVGVFDSPRLTGNVCTSLSFWYTFIDLVALSTWNTVLPPMVAVPPRSSSRNLSPTGRPPSAALTVILVPVFQ